MMAEEEETGQEEAREVEASSASAPLEPHLHWALGLVLALKAFLGLAEFTHLNHGHDAWDRTVERSDAGDRWGPRAWRRVGRVGVRSGAQRSSKEQSVERHSWTALTQATYRSPPEGCSGPHTGVPPWSTFHYQVRK